jgi:hypothetical protein
MISLGVQFLKDGKTREKTIASMDMGMLGCIEKTGGFVELARGADQIEVESSLLSITL